MPVLTTCLGPRTAAAGLVGTIWPITSQSNSIRTAASCCLVPALIADLGDEAAWRYVEFLTASIRNPHTRCAYARACNRFFAWCEER